MLRKMIPALAVLCAGCSGGGGGNDDGGAGVGGGGGGTGGRGVEAICQVIGSGNHVSGLGIEDPVLGFDGHLDSWASLGPGASAAGTLAGGGISRPAGDVVGIAFTRPTLGAISVTITTYLGNVPRDSMDAGTMEFHEVGWSNACPGTCTVGNGQAFIGIDASQGYDRIEAAITINGFEEPLQIRELCVR